jgi:hypothetical protein
MSCPSNYKLFILRNTIKLIICTVSQVPECITISILRVFLFFILSKYYSQQILLLHPQSSSHFIPIYKIKVLWIASFWL